MIGGSSLRASVIVVAYNSRRYLGACLGSVVREMSLHDELIVVDNGSTDGSADFVAANYPQARLIRSGNDGYAGGNNRGAAAARGAYLVFLNPDTELMPGALDALVEPLAANGGWGLTTPCLVYMQQPELVNACGNTMHYTGLTYCRGAGRLRADYLHSCEVDAISGAAFAISSTLFAELGGFDESFFMYVEDTDLSWRARLAGHRCGYVAAALVRHDHQHSYSPTKAFYLDRNRHLMLLKNLERRTYLLLLPGLLLGELVTWGFMLLKGPRFWGVKLRVYRSLWARRVALPAAKRAAQGSRRLNDRELLGGMTYRLEFEQLAGRQLGWVAGLLLHPAFRAARRLFVGAHL